MNDRRAGFTLIEVLVTTLMLVLLGGALYQMTRATFDSRDRLMSENTVYASARSAIDDLCDRIRGAKLPTGSTSALISAAATDVSFYDYYDQYNKAQSHTLVTVRYWLSGTNLRRTVNSLPAGGSVMASNVSSLTFTYYWISGSSWTSATSVGSPTAVAAFSCSFTLNDGTSTRQSTGIVQLRQKCPM